MKTTKNVEYGIVLVRGLNLETPTKLADITASANLSLHFMEQVARRLRVAKIIKSIRGPGGGYVKASNKPVSFLTIENAVSPTPDKEGSPVMQPFMNKINDVLGSMTI